MADGAATPYDSGSPMQDSGYLSSPDYGASFSPVQTGSATPGGFTEYQPQGFGGGLSPYSARSPGGYSPSSPFNSSPSSPYQTSPSSPGFYSPTVGSPTLASTKYIADQLFQSPGGAAFASSPRFSPASPAYAASPAFTREPFSYPIYLAVQRLILPSNES